MSFLLRSQIARGFLWAFEILVLLLPTIWADGASGQISQISSPPFSSILRYQTARGFFRAFVTLVPILPTVFADLASLLICPFLREPKPPISPKVSNRSGVPLGL